MRRNRNWDAIARMVRRRREERSGWVQVWDLKPVRCCRCGRLIKRGEWAIKFAGTNEYWCGCPGAG